MQTRRMMAVVISAIGFVGSQLPHMPAAGALPQPPPTLIPVPSIAGDFADPVVREYNGIYYAYATGDANHHIQMTSSPDGNAWTPTVEALTALPAWADPKPLHTWAPYVWRFGATYVMYYSTLETASKQQCISIATSTTALGPFIDASSGPLTCPHFLGGAIDPSIFIDTTVAPSVPYLLYKNDIPPPHPSALWSVQLAANGQGISGSASILLAAEPGWEDNIIEAPSMVFDGARYELFYSGNHWDSTNYASGLARCTGPSGPCVRTTNGPILTGADGKFGPGGIETFRDEHNVLGITYHAWTPGHIGYGLHLGARQMWIESLAFDHGVPIVGGRTSDPPSEHHVVAIVNSPIGQGHEIVFASGRVLTGGDFTGSSFDGPFTLAKPIVGAARMPGTQATWQVASDGGVFAFDGAPFFGSTGNITLAQPIVGMAATPSGKGYWLVASDGGIFSFGDAAFYGSMGATPLNQPVVGMAATPSGKGYWLVASDGGVFSFGDAAFYGSMGATPLNKPIVGIAASIDGRGYGMVAADGGIFTFGNFTFAGSTGGQGIDSPIIGMASTLTGKGYWLASSRGAVYAFGDAIDVP